MLVNEVTQHRKLLLCTFSPQGPQVSSVTFFCAIYSYLFLKNGHISVIKLDKKDISHVSNHAVLQSGR